MSTVVCEFCGDFVCTRCDDAADHPGGLAHCADPVCVGLCPECQTAAADDHAADLAADVALERCER